MKKFFNLEIEHQDAPDNFGHYDGKKYYFCPAFEGPVTSTLGAGDAFASTFCAGLDKFDRDISKALIAGSINSAGVVSTFGATEGLLTFDEIKKRMFENPDFKGQTVEA